MAKLGTHFEDHLKKLGFSVEAKQWGQPRPYADHIFSGTLTILAPIEEDERLQVRRYLAKMRYDKNDKPVPMRTDPHEWHQTYCTRLERVSPGVWAFSLTEAYTD